MIKTIQDFLEEIQNKNESAIEAAHKILEISGDDYSQLNSHLQWNKYLIQQVNICKENTPERLEALLKFAYNEFVKSTGSRHDLFGLKKKDALVYNSSLEQAHFQDIHNQFVEPLIDVFENYEANRKLVNKKLRDTVLIVTALPLEFRAVVRRLQFLNDVKKIDFSTPRPIQLRPEEDAFEFVFDSQKDNYIHVNAGDNDPYDRPFYVFVEGVFYRKGVAKKVHVLLLPNYGHIQAKEGMRECERYSNNIAINYAEVIVAGIAGGIDKENEIKLGDLVVSCNIYGSETKKASQAPKKFNGTTKENEIERELEFRSIQKFEYSAIDFNIENWEPKLVVAPPENITDTTEKGFNKIFTSDFVSIDTLSKSIWFKEKLWHSFPTCKAIEMEAFGVSTYMIREKKRKPVRIIKSICDYGDFRKNKIWQPYCADVAASFVEDYLITKYGKQIS